jgi:GNAT superfamily N-acetyltransferase
MDRVTPADMPATCAILKRQPHLAMFPLSNLDRYGLDGAHPRASSFWRDGDNVLCVTRNGIVLPVIAPDAASAAARAIAGRELTGVIGEAKGARALVLAAGLTGPATLDRDEPQFLLDLDDLTVPDTSGTLIALGDAPRTLMEDWRVAYDVEALGDTEAVARSRVTAELDDYIAHDSHRVLMVEGQPVCTTGFNASLPGIVQVGGVYTPPHLRNRGYARRAVALHLSEAWVRGVKQATLFASSGDAARAYRSIGFQPCGDWTLCLFEHPRLARD